MAFHLLPDKLLVLPPTGGYVFGRVCLFVCLFYLGNTIYLYDYLFLQLLSMLCLLLIIFILLAFFAYFYGFSLLSVPIENLVNKKMYLYK